MSSQGARSVSMGMVGGVAAMLFFWQGLLIWAGFVGWAAFIDAGGDTPALSKTIAGTVFGVLLAWGTLIVNGLIQVPDEGWLWVPRIGVSVAIALWILVLASRATVLSRVSTSLLGFAAALGATVAAAGGIPGTYLRFFPHQSNPLINVVLSLVLGAVFGLASTKLADTFTKK